VGKRAQRLESQEECGKKAGHAPGNFVKTALAENAMGPCA
jgi:hypothetical protein